MWIKYVMDKKIKKEIKNSIFGKFIQRMSIKVERDRLIISIVQPRYGRFGYGENRTNFEKFVEDLFEQYGYNKESIDVQFV
jgi:ribosomal protein S3